MEAGERGTVLAIRMMQSISQEVDFYFARRCLSGSCFAIIGFGGENL